MPRPRLPIGTFGEITFRRVARGRVEARTRYRDWDGKTRLVQATADGSPAAERALKVKLSERSLFQSSFTAMTPDSDFTALVAYWLEDLDLEGRLSPSTRELYERDVRTPVLPAFAELTLGEIGVARCDRFIKQLAKQSYSRAKYARVVLCLALALAVRHEIIPRNPMDHIAACTAPRRLRMRSRWLRSTPSGPPSGAGSPGCRGQALAPTVSSARSSRSCSARRRGSGRCWRSGAATSTSPARPRQPLRISSTKPSGEPERCPDGPGRHLRDSAPPASPSRTARHHARGWVGNDQLIRPGTTLRACLLRADSDQAELR